MPKLVTGIQVKNHHIKNYRSRFTSFGYSLIEILVVLLIIGITVGFALLSWGDFGEKRRCLNAAYQFQQYVELVQQQAILESTTFGIKINLHSYETLRFISDEKWQPLTKNRSIHYKQLSDSIMLHSHQHSSTISKLTPEIIIQPSGELSAFTLDFGSNTQPKMVQVIGASSGDLKIQQSS